VESLPFTADVPVEALWTPPSLDHFRWRMEQQVREGGFALITGDPGTGKSVALRLLAHHLATLPDVEVGVVMRPQSGLGDFYREIGALFGVVLAPHNRWAGFKALREKWLVHVEATASRIRVRLNLDYLTPKELLDWLRHAIDQAGNPQLMTPELMTTLAEHAAGNLRVLSIMASDLLALAARRELRQLDQKLYLDAYAQQPRPRSRTAETTARG